MQSLTAILGQVEVGKLTLPKFQRGYVWQRWQVRELMRSLYQGYPVGSFLVWDTPTATFLLDGQQRITSLYGIMLGEAPKFSDADPNRFLNLYFNMEEEVFEFYGKTKMQHDPRWVSVTDVMQQGVEDALKPFEGAPNFMSYLGRLNRIATIKNRTFYVEPIDGMGRDLDEVVEMFNQVNSGGTKLSKGDLALAKISVNWPQAREEMNKRLEKWRNNSYDFDLDWLLRCINALVTGRADFEELSKPDISAAQVQNGLERAEKHIDYALELIASQLGLADKSVLRSPNSIPAIIRFIDREPGLPNYEVLGQLLFWYIHTFLWGRYSGSTETVMRQDLQTIDEKIDAVGALIDRLRQSRGHLRIESHDFDVATSLSRFFPMLYLLTRVFGARDFCSGIILSKHLLSPMSRLERHHLFPKAKLRKFGFTNRYEINALANFTFLTKQCNLEISAKLPEDYFPEYEAKHPGVLASHWIPQDRELWKIEKYHDFLAARRELLAKAANDFLDQLLRGEVDQPAEAESPLAHSKRPRPISIASDEEETALIQVMDWMEAKGLPRGELGYELALAENGEFIVLDLSWPNGIQEGLSRKAALLIDESQETLSQVNHADYEYFTDVDEFQRHVQRDILGE